MSGGRNREGRRKGLGLGRGKRFSTGRGKGDLEGRENRDSDGRGAVAGRVKGEGRGAGTGRAKRARVHKRKGKEMGMRIGKGNKLVEVNDRATCSAEDFIVSFSCLAIKYGMVE